MSCTGFTCYFSSPSVFQRRPRDPVYTLPSSLSDPVVVSLDPLPYDRGALSTSGIMNTLYCWKIVSDGIHAGRNSAPSRPQW